jgi:hypothetical protein
MAADVSARVAVDASAAPTRTLPRERGSDRLDRLIAPSTWLGEHEEASPAPSFVHPGQRRAAAQPRPTRMAPPRQRP